MAAGRAQPGQKGSWRRRHCHAGRGMQSQADPHCRGLCSCTHQPRACRIMRRACCLLRHSVLARHGLTACCGLACLRRSTGAAGRLAPHQGLSSPSSTSHTRGKPVEEQDILQAALKQAETRCRAGACARLGGGSRLWRPQRERAPALRRQVQRVELIVQLGVQLIACHKCPRTPPMISDMPT